MPFVLRKQISASRHAMLLWNEKEVRERVNTKKKLKSASQVINKRAITKQMSPKYAKNEEEIVRVFFLCTDL